jgi:Na+/H+ antiporter NhaD/arsenite permease-like protein
MRRAARRAAAAAAALAALVAAPASALASGDGSFGKELSVAWVVPFGILLLAIAILPLAASHWWEHNRNKGIIAAACAVPVAGMLLSQHQSVALGHAAVEYVSFIALLGSLFIISGGILITGDIRATPKNNTLLLAIGGVLANLVGTTGASMLLIRPFLRINSQRKHVTHSFVFFIFVVSNVGGCLTPLGDPPLFLGFLRGVPFEWTLGLAKEWAFMLGALLALYFVLDTMRYGKEAPEDVRRDDTQVEPFRIRGNLNFLLLGGVLAAILVPVAMKLEGLEAFGATAGGMAAMAVVSLATTSKELREKNGFAFGPIVEVAVLFAGIFVAMIPALAILGARGSELGISQPWQFFWASGTLSSFLDNAPTYLTFATVAQGMLQATPEVFGGGATVAFTGGPVPEALLIAVSLGSVFMGANTYIGNGPNFMVKSIVEGAGRKMPSFFGYMAWSTAILVPLFVVVTFLFLV